MTDLSVWLAPLSALSFGAIGLAVGWAVWAPEPRWFPEPPPPPAPKPKAPPGLEYAASGFRERYAERCHAIAAATAEAALVEVAGIDPLVAPERAEQSAAAELGQRLALDLAQAGWVEGARDLAAAVRVSSPLPPAVTERLLDFGVRVALSPSPTEAP